MSRWVAVDGSHPGVNDASSAADRRRRRRRRRRVQAALAFLSDAFPGGEPPSAAAAAEALLNADLRQLGCGGLPADVNRAAAAKLAGPIVVQVRCLSAGSLLVCWLAGCRHCAASPPPQAAFTPFNLRGRGWGGPRPSGTLLPSPLSSSPSPSLSEARDIAQPSRTASESDERRGRLLRLALTDGKARCVGLELQPLPLSAEQVGRLAAQGLAARGRPGGARAGLARWLVVRARSRHAQRKSRKGGAAVLSGPPSEQTRSSASPGPSHCRHLLPLAPPPLPRQTLMLKEPSHSHAHQPPHLFLFPFAGGPWHQAGPVGSHGAAGGAAAGAAQRAAAWREGGRAGRGMGDPAALRRHAR